MPARVKEKRKKLFENEENQDIINLKLIDSILDDNEQIFTNIMLQKIVDKSSLDQTFTLKNYKLPKFLSLNPSIASVCAFFGAERCFNSLGVLFPDESKSFSLKKTDNDSRTLLHFACPGGNLNILRELEQRNFDINQKDRKNMTPCCYAAMMGHLNVVKYLWTKGAKIIPSLNDISPFHVACLYGHLDIAMFIYDTFLSDNYENAKLLFQPNLKRNTTPLHLACEGGHNNVVQYLSSMTDLFKIQVNAYDSQLRTPIVICCQNGSLNCLKTLSLKNETIFDVPKRKFLPLIEASANGHLDIVKFLLTQKCEETYINKTNTQNVNAIQAAITNRHIKIVQFLINNGAIKNYSKTEIGELMMTTVYTLDLEIIKLLDKFAEIPYNDAIPNDDEGITWGDKYMQQACLHENEEIVSFLLDKNCNFNHVDLSTNVKHDWSSFMDFLLDNGVDLSSNLPNKKPLIVSTISTGNLRRIKKMIKMGAILNKEIISDYNCVYEACSSKKLELFKFLMSYKPIINNANEIINLCITKTGEAKNKNDKKTIDLYYFMIDTLLSTQKVDLNNRNNRNSSLVSIAASNRCIDILNLFENNGADFVNCILDIRKMTTDDFLPVLQFFKDRGCKFNQSSPILDSLLLDCQYNLNSKILILLLDFIPRDEIVHFFNYCGNISDIAMRSNLSDTLLLIFKKVNMVILPKNCNKECFMNWISECNLPELTDFVSKSINT